MTSTHTTNFKGHDAVRAFAGLALAIASTAAALADEQAGGDDPCKGPLPAIGTPFSGVVTNVIEGDVICISGQNGDVEIRLADYNALELSEPDGGRARDELRKIALGKFTECFVSDGYAGDAIVALCMIDRRNIGNLMRATGLPENENYPLKESGW